MGLLRTVRESPEAIGTVEYLRKRTPRFEQLWDGWIWRLARSPYVGATVVPNTNPTLYLIKSSPVLSNYGFKFTLTFKYTVTDELVDLLSVRIVDIPS